MNEGSEVADHPDMVLRLEIDLIQDITLQDIAFRVVGQSIGARESDPDFDRIRGL